MIKFIEDKVYSGHKVTSCTSWFNNGCFLGLNAGIVSGVLLVGPAWWFGLLGLASMLLIFMSLSRKINDEELKDIERRRAILEENFECVTYHVMEKPK